MKDDEVCEAELGPSSLERGVLTRYTCRPDIDPESTPLRTMGARLQDRVLPHSLMCAPSISPYISPSPYYLVYTSLLFSPTVVVRAGYRCFQEDNYYV